MKKCIAVLLAALMMLTGLLQVSAADLLFINAEDEHYYDILTNLGVFSLYQEEEGFFDGTKEVSRGEAAMAIGGLLNLAAGTNSSIGDAFIDVLPTDPASGSIAAMVGMKAMSGFGDNLFRPYDTIQSVHFIKALLVALGYQWKAEYAGGYPDGYMKLAHDTGLIEGVAVENNQPLTRTMLFKILYNALFVQVFDVVSVSPDSVLYETNKKSTLLTQYYDIYEETDVVYTDSITSLNDSFAPNEKFVLIGDERIYLGEDRSILTHLGQRVTYFYKWDEATDTKNLISFTPYRNVIVSLTDTSIENINNGEVEYLSTETGRTETLNYTSGTDIVYNGVRKALNLKTTLENLSGTAEFIDNNDDDITDVIIINDYIYDAIESIDLSRETIYCEDEKYDLRNVNSYIIENDLGQPVALEELRSGDVLAITKSTNGEFIKLTVLSASVTGGAMQRSADTITVGDTAYPISSGCPADCLTKMRLGSTYSFVLNVMGEIVYIKEASADSLQFGYLITYGQISDAFTQQISLKILTTSSVKIFETKDKIKINDAVVEAKDVVATLRNLKNQLSIETPLASDGEISQMIRYQVDANNVITSIYTAKTTDNDNLVLKHNTEGVEKSVRRYYGTATIDINEFFGNSSTPIFVVPQDDQETSEDDFFNVKNINDVIKESDNKVFETYTIGDDILPSAVVLYLESSAEKLPGSLPLCMLESLETVVNKDGALVTRFNIINGSNKFSYLSEEAIDTTGLEVGDTIMLNLSPLNEVIAWGKVYDESTGQFGIDPDSDTNASFESANFSGNRSIMKLSVYRCQDGYILGTSKGFDDIDEALDNLFAVNLAKCGAFPVYDSETQEITIERTDVLVEYVRDKENYSEAIVLHNHNNLIGVVLYK